MITAAGVDGVEVDTQARGCQRPITAQEGLPATAAKRPVLPSIDHASSARLRSSALNVVPYPVGILHG